MTWIKLTDVGGPDYVNLDQVYKIIVDTGTLTLTFYDANSILPTTYTFAALTDLQETLAKLESLARIIDLDNLAPQQQ